MTCKPLISTQLHATTATDVGRTVKQIAECRFKARMGYSGGGSGNQQFARLGRKIAALLQALVSLAHKHSAHYAHAHMCAVVKTVPTYMAVESTNNISNASNTFSQCNKMYIFTRLGCYVLCKSG